MLRFVPVMAALLGCVGPLSAAPGELSAAVSLFDARRDVEATQAFERIVAAHPDEPQANLYLGRLAIDRQDFGNAVIYLEKAGLAAPNDPGVQYWLGLAYADSISKVSVFSLCRTAKRIRNAFERAVELEPANVDYRWALMVYDLTAPSLVGGGLEKATHEAEEIGKRDPVIGHDAQAEICIRSGNFGQAFAELDALLELSPKNYAGSFKYGALAAQTGQHLDRGIALLRSCLGEEPPREQPEHYRVHWILGEAFEMKGERLKARQEYEASLKGKPDFGEALDSLKRLSGRSDQRISLGF